MRSLHRHLLVFVLLSLFGLGCRSCDTIESSKLAQSEIYQDYSVVANKDGCSASATFRVSGQTGTTIVLVAPAKVGFNGKAMNENARTTFNGSYYSGNCAGFDSNNEFLFTDGNGKEYRNSISFDRIELNEGPSTIRRGSQIEIPLSRPLAADESLEGSIVSQEPMPATTANNSTGSNHLQNAAGPSYSETVRQNLNESRDAIVIRPETLSNFVPGKARLSLTARKSSRTSQSTSVGGSIDLEYHFPEIQITVIN